MCWEWLSELDNLYFESKYMVENLEQDIKKEEIKYKLIIADMFLKDLEK
jgi:hypothetical protein